jgi:chromosome partitioning protein
MILTVANHKGGVGKTAITAHLAWYFAEKGHRTLVIDLDSQANLTGCFAYRDDTLTWPSSDLLFQKDGPKAIPTKTETANVDLLPASPRAHNTDRGDIGALFQARRAITEIAKDYEYVLIDTAPALGLRLSAAIAASNRVIAPLLPELFGLEGLGSLLAEMDSIRSEWAPNLGQPIFVVNQLSPNAKQHSDAVTFLEQTYKLMKPLLRRNIAVADALAMRRPVWIKSTNAEAAKLWREFCQNLEAAL